ncbi:MAG: flagellar hook capping FlgD N-terminal domain-containing protein, partial [Betaproteobacteria bacterium]
RIPVRTLGQNDFLKLLVTQMTSQDPLNPQKDTEFIAQMAQFSSLEQSKTMSADISQLRTQQQFLQANAMLGQAVSLQVDKDTTAQGIVSAVQIEAGTPKLMVGGQAFALSQVLSVARPPAAN